jgi:uncharacterized protein (TIGR02145 family)
MKTILLFLACLSLIIGCSTTNENVTTSTTTVVPLPPTNLSGTNVASMQINLNWTDNSTNETGFKIERKTDTSNYAIVGNTSVDITKFTDTGLVNNTTYTYRVYSTNSVGNSLTYSNEFKITPFGIPILTTSPVTSITTISAIGGGNITDTGGTNVIVSGIVWSNSPNPTIDLSTKTVNGSGTGIFTSNISSLTPISKYYVRAYARNTKGTAYGDEISFTTPSIFSNGNGVTDVCGNIYPSIIIIGQEWMQKNLDVCKYRNGDVIPQVQDPTQWTSLTTGAWCYYENDTANGPVYGKLYNGYAVNDPRGLAPQGWHIPSDVEWTKLENALISNGANYDGTNSGNKIAKSMASKTLWELSTDIGRIGNNLNANNSSGFNALPGGLFHDDGDPPHGVITCFWSSTSFISTGFSENVAYYRELNNGNNSLIRSYNRSLVGYSVRCLKN